MIIHTPLCVAYNTWKYRICAFIARHTNIPAPSLFFIFFFIVFIRHTYLKLLDCCGCELFLLLSLSLCCSFFYIYTGERQILRICATVQNYSILLPRRRNNNPLLFSTSEIPCVCVSSAASSPHYFLLTLTRARGNKGTKGKKQNYIWYFIFFCAEADKPSSYITHTSLESRTQHEFPNLYAFFTISFWPRFNANLPSFFFQCRLLAFAVFVTTTTKKKLISFCTFFFHARW